MTMFRMPIFTWNIFVTSILVLIVFPAADPPHCSAWPPTAISARIYDPANGGVLLYQHLFWFFGPPGVHHRAAVLRHRLGDLRCSPANRSSATPPSSTPPSPSRRCRCGVVHHMYVTGAILLPFFSFMTFLIAVPTGIKFFNWIGTMWKGQLTFETPMLFSMGFLVTFLAGGLSGVLLASPAGLPRQRQLLRHRALPLRAVRHHRVRHLCGHLLLVPEDDGASAR